MGKAPFKLRSGNVTPFKEMGSSAVKHTTAKTHFHSTDRQDTTDIIADPKIANVPSKTKDEIKTEQTQKRLDQTTRSLDLKEREILLKEKSAEPKKETKKVSVEQQLADKKFKDLKKEKIRLGEKGYAKGWSDKKLARKDKRLTKKIKKAEKMTDPLERQAKAMEMAKAQDIFKALSMGGSKWTGSRTAAQDALKKQQQKGLIDQDVSAVTDAENKTKLDPGESFVYDYTKGKDYTQDAEAWHEEQRKIQQQEENPYASEDGYRYDLDPKYKDRWKLKED